MLNIEDILKKAIEEILDMEMEDDWKSRDFKEDLGADSLDTVELVMAMEDKLDMAISDEDAENLNTPQKFLEYLESHHA